MRGFLTLTAVVLGVAAVFAPTKAEPKSNPSNLKKLVYQPPSQGLCSCVNDPAGPGACTCEPCKCITPNAKPVSQPYPDPVTWTPPIVDIHPQPQQPVKPAVMAKAPTAGYICGPYGCGPAVRSAPRYAGGGERRGMYVRWYPGRRVIGFFRGRRR